MLFLALLAISILGLAAGPASGGAATFTATAGATIVGEDVGVVKFTVTGQEVFCESASYKGTAPSASFTTLTVTPTYTNCKAKIFGSTINATVTGFGAGGCDYVLHSTGTADLVCAEGKDVTVVAGTCMVHVPAQSGLGTIAYDTGTVDGAKDLTLTLNVTGITEQHTDGFLCPLSGSGHTSTGVLEGEITATIQKQDPTFTAPAGAPIIGRDIGVVKFTVTGQEVFCESVRYDATAPAASFGTLTVAPTYASCKAKIFGSTINTTIAGFGAGGCDYVLHSTGTVDLVCPEGKDVTIIAGTCMVHIPAQSGLGTIDYDTRSLGNENDLTMTLDVTGIKETHTDGFLCPLSGSGTTATGLLEGTITARAVADGTTEFTTPGNDAVDIVGHDVGLVRFTVSGVEVFCESVEYAGATTAESFTTLTVTPKYTECHASALGESATITGFGAGGCDYLLHSSGRVDLVCAEGKDVTITAGTCVVHIPAQAGLGTITYDTDVSDTTGKLDLTLTLEVTNVKETHTDGSLCVFQGSGTTETGVLEGEITATALLDGNPVDLTDHDEGGSWGLTDDPGSQDLTDH